MPDHFLTHDTSATSSLCQNNNCQEDRFEDTFVGNWKGWRLHSVQSKKEFEKSPLWHIAVFRRGRKKWNEKKRKVKQQFYSDCFRNNRMSPLWSSVSPHYNYLLFHVERIWFEKYLPSRIRRGAFLMILEKREWDVPKKIHFEGFTHV